MIDNNVRLTVQASVEIEINGLLSCLTYAYEGIIKDIAKRACALKGAKGVLTGTAFTQTGEFFAFIQISHDDFTKAF